MTKVLLYELGQSISYGRLPLLSKVLWPMLLASSDDQGRGLAEPDAIKWHICPNVPELTIDNIPAQLQAMAEQDMIHIYQDGRDRHVYQIVRWWEFQQLQYAHPSRFPPPAGWIDRLRYTVRGQGQTMENWDQPGGFQADHLPQSTHNPGGNPPGNQGGNPPEIPTKLNLTEPNLKEGQEVGADAPADAIPTPASYEEWLELVRKPPEGSNRIAVLVNMHNALYPGRDPPDYAFMGKAAKQVGGAGYMCKQLWICSTNNVAGDVVPYILAAHKRNKASRDKDSNEPAGWAGLREWVEEEGIEWQPKTP